MNLVLKIEGDANQYETERIYERSVIYPTLKDLSEGDVISLEGFIVDNFTIDLMRVDKISADNIETLSNYRYFSMCGVFCVMCF